MDIGASFLTEGHCWEAMLAWSCPRSTAVDLANGLRKGKVVSIWIGVCANAVRVCGFNTCVCLCSPLVCPNPRARIIQVDCGLSSSRVLYPLDGQLSLTAAQRRTETQLNHWVGL
jgi:hypothetical protein